MLGEEEDIEDDSSFSRKSVYARMAIIFAGPFFNFILAFIFSVILTAVMGYQSPQITVVADNTPAQKSGLQVGDVVKEINGKTMTIDGDISLYTAYYGFPKDEDVTMVVERDGQEKTIVMKPELMKDASGNENYRIGINHGKWEKVGVLGTLKYSTYEMKYWIETVVKSLQGLVTKRFKASDVSGPVGIVSAMGKNIEASGDKDNGGGPGMMVMSMILCYLPTLAL